jgi:sec-independent protein translocase protein TatC
MVPVSNHPEQATMSFGDHLEELRRRLILALLAPLPLSIVAFFFSARLIEVLLDPLFGVLAAHDLPQQVQALSPPEMVMAQLKLSIIFALIASAPWIVWQLWRFISPGLFAHEKRFVYFLIPGSAVLTIAGAALLYFVMLPLMLHVLVMFGSSMRTPVVVVPESSVAAEADEPLGGLMIEVLDENPATVRAGQVWIKMPERVLRFAVLAGQSGEFEILELSLAPPSRLIQQYRVSEYINFVLLLLLGMVLAFQMPLVIVLLGWLGLASAAWLRKQRRYALLICAAVSAVITPADAISMLAMLIPLYGLFELGILLLVIAPASAIAEGRFRWRAERTDNERDHPERSPSPVQPSKSVPRVPLWEQEDAVDPADDADEPGDERDAR